MKQIFFEEHQQILRNKAEEILPLLNNLHYHEIKEVFRIVKKLAKKIPEPDYDSELIILDELGEPNPNNPNPNDLSNPTED